MVIDNNNMVKLSRHTINAILYTILAHLLVVIIALMLSINTKLKHVEQAIIIMPEMLSEVDEDVSNLSENEMDDEAIERYLQNLKNAGSNYNQESSDLKDNQGLSKEEIKQMYEEEMLREKYGDDYEKMMNTSPDDYLPEDFNPHDYNHDIDKNQQNVNHSGPALVFATLNDETRATRYLHVPVFTCEGSGTIVIGITISSNGKVKNTRLISANTTNDQACLIQAAEYSAKHSEFAIISTGETQGGKITYQFLGQ